MKKISFLLALIAVFFTGIALASAGVTTLNGTAQVQRGTAPAHALRLGDEVNQGDTISTGANSSIVLKFDDGHVAALTSNSRMTINAYEYDPQSQKGNVLLSLISGGMRTITGLIGHNSPERVAYRAANATIGIRGTDISIVTDLGTVVVTVNDGEISFKLDDCTITVPTGQGLNAPQGVSGRPGCQFPLAAAQQIVAQLPANLAAAIGGLQGLTDAINQAAPGTPRSGSGGVLSGTGGTLGGGVTGGGTGGGGGTGPQPGSPH